MSSDEQAPLFFSGDARLGLSRECVRRMARSARLGNGSKVLDLGCGNGGATLLLAREFGCSVVAADSDAAALDALSRRLRSQSLDARVEPLKVDFAQLTFADGEFNLVLAPANPVYSFSDAATKLRRYLPPRGRLLICHPVRVAQQIAPALTDYWERRLGRPLMFPRELLQILAESGYEPEGVEALSESELDELYRGLDQRASKLPKDAQERSALTEQIQLQRAQGGRSSVSFACAVARRKEPGEKPPAARDRG